MKKSIAEFVAQCPNCQQAKIENQKPSGLIQNIEIPTWIWEVIVDQLTKFAHFMPVKTTYTAENYVKLYIKEIVRLHGVPVAYELELPSELEFVHPVFHASMLRKFIRGPSRVVLIKDVQVTEDLSYEEMLVAILDRQVRKLRTKDVAYVKVLWRNKNTEEMTWEEEE
ncbi:uncharacterized protein [Nicotiana sylvestris]|uniref:uncharacterized protein n=1 Tax=Nicotiana sylvestris TaxID=4096 RepID=UPI00388CA8B5